MPAYNYRVGLSTHDTWNWWEASVQLDYMHRLVRPATDEESQLMDLIVQGRATQYDFKRLRQLLNTETKWSTTMTWVAGHNFEDSPTGRRCISTKADGSICGLMWLAIADTTIADIGKPDIAHSGNVNQAEVTQIEQERARLSSIDATKANDIWGKMDHP